MKGDEVSGFRVKERAEEDPTERGSWSEGIVTALSKGYTPVPNLVVLSGQWWNMNE